MQFSDIMTTG